MNKKDQIKKCQEIRDRYKNGEFVLNDNDFDYLCSIFEKHRWYAQKTDGQPYWFYVDTSKEYKTRGFYIERKDGTRTDFSFYECIYPTKGYKGDFVKAARAAIKEQIIDFRDQYFSKILSSSCPICNRQIVKNYSHIDHYPVKFKTILDEFVANYNIKDFQKLTEPGNWDNIHGVEITDLDIKDKWQEFHKSRAKLRAICPKCNLRLG